MEYNGEKISLKKDIKESAHGKITEIYILLKI